MKKRILNIMSNPLFSGSVIMIFGSNFANLINYIYHTLMGRLLGPSSYSELAAILSLVNLLGIIIASMSLVVTKYVASAKNDSGVRSIISWVNIRINLFSILTFLLLILFSGTISNFLNLSSSALVITASFIFIFSYPTNLYRAILQGTLQFNKAVFSLIAENLFKIGVGIALVVYGYSVFGAVGGIVISVIVGYLVSRFYVSRYLIPANKEFTDSKNLIKYTLPVFLQSFAIASLNSADLILVKHFFDNHTAGLYSSISTLGKIIFFAAGPIAAVMFPMVSKRNSNGESYKSVFLLSLLMTFFISILVELVFILSPGFAIKALFGTAYLETTGLLVWFGLFMILFTFSYFFVNYFLSIGKTKVVLLPIIAAFLQISGIWFFHNSLFQVIEVSIFMTFALLVSLILYYFHL